MTHRSSAPRRWLPALPLLLALIVTACGALGQQGAEVATKPADGQSPGDDPAGQGVGQQLTSSSEPEAQLGSEALPQADDEVDDEQSEPTVDPVGYADDFSVSIQPIFAQRCASCHNLGGPGASHWELETAFDISADHVILSEVVASGYMPPWPAGGDSPDFKHDPRLRPDQIQAIADWAAAGGELDVAANTPVVAPSGVVGLSEPDLRLTAPAYTGDPNSFDDYRCQVYDPALEDGGWITGYEFVPDQTEVVHHAIGYLLPATARDAAIAKDRGEAGPGWSCYGSSGLGADDIFLGWAPGQDATLLPEGAGLWVEPGGFIVVQIHYHYQGSAPADSSALVLDLADQEDLAGFGGDLAPVSVAQYLAPAEIPCSADEQGPLCDRDTALAAARDRYGSEGVQADRILDLCGFNPDNFAHMNQGLAATQCDLPVGFMGGTGEIVAILGHQHELGVWLKMTLNPDTPGERVLLDIPVWDFDWQLNYEPEESIVLNADDIVRLECGWDRSLRAPGLEPAYVLWADGTNDEMCFATISTRPAS